jgi:hypothetical protein
MRGGLRLSWEKLPVERNITIHQEIQTLIIIDQSQLFERVPRD